MCFSLCIMYCVYYVYCVDLTLLTVDLGVITALFCLMVVFALAFTLLKVSSYYRVVF